MDHIDSDYNSSGTSNNSTTKKHDKSKSSKPLFLCDNDKSPFMYDSEDSEKDQSKLNPKSKKNREKKYYPIDDFSIKQQGNRYRKSRQCLRHWVRTADAHGNKINSTDNEEVASQVTLKTRTKKKVKAKGMFDNYISDPETRYWHEMVVKAKGMFDNYISDPETRYWHEKDDVLTSQQKKVAKRKRRRLRKLEAASSIPDGKPVSRRAKEKAVKAIRDVTTQQSDSNQSHSDYQGNSSSSESGEESEEDNNSGMASDEEESDSEIIHNTSDFPNKRRVTRGVASSKGPPLTSSIYTNLRAKKPRKASFYYYDDEYDLEEENDFDDPVVHMGDGYQQNSYKKSKKSAKKWRKEQKKKKKLEKRKRLREEAVQNSSRRRLVKTTTTVSSDSDASVQSLFDEEVHPAAADDAVKTEPPPTPPVVNRTIPVHTLLMNILAVKEECTEF
eukprot:CAMPEP_0170093170 /NCGR_PEP_ID=MMETSP0019_2-20121128/26326_1 /TAXON_ID=98059 /ORGANISM="Dinobryon sp., Strain UTEXLB2267" /LENGTH=443 /DNA_ID=CAMNT_0010313909 /DNA_START=140 /DNA_END=1472 /DNA_ORIENTATION=-